MTWGEIRLALARKQPDLDALDGWLKERYEQILDAHPWRQLRTDAAITTVAAYRTGTIEVTNGSNAVTLTGGTWTAAMTGRTMQVYGAGGLYTFTRTGDTTGTLDRVFEGATAEDASYVIVQTIYSLAAACRKVEKLLRPDTGLPMMTFNAGDFRAAIGQLIVLGMPGAWAPATDASNGARRVELHFAPDAVYTVPYVYQRKVTGYDPSDTATSPLDWIPAKLILDGVRADAAADAGNYNGSDRYAKDFMEGLAKLRFLDKQGEPAKVLKLAAHYNEPPRYGRTGNFRLP